LASAFSGTTTNTLSILDPTNSFTLVKQLDLSSSNTIRDIALDGSGNLFFSANGHTISYITDVVSNPAALTDNNFQVWYANTSFSTQPNFNGLDNGDGKVNAADYVVWRDNLGQSTLMNRGTGITGPVGTSDYNFWKAHFGNTSGLGASAVPEPASALLMLLGFAAFGCKRRS
jgi:hypothetical protein